MSTLQVDDSLSGWIELSNHCQTMIITPDRDDDDDLRVDDSADDKDYDPAPIANPSPKSWPKKVRNKNSEPKSILDRNFMCFLRPHTFDYEPFRRGKQDMYPIAEIERINIKCSGLTS